MIRKNSVAHPPPGPLSGPDAPPGPFDPPEEESPPKPGNRFRPSRIYPGMMSIWPEYPPQPATGP